jgi:hypothetical protein
VPEEPLSTGVGRPVGRRITLKEIQDAYESMSQSCPPILTLTQAADMANLRPSTLKRKVSEGEFKDSACRGKPLRFWRDRFVYELMNKGR